MLIVSATFGFGACTVDLPLEAAVGAMALMPGVVVRLDEVTARLGTDDAVRGTMGLEVVGLVFIGLATGLVESIRRDAMAVGRATVELLERTDG